jgi:hypothetical protein
MHRTVDGILIVLTLAAPTGGGEVTAAKHDAFGVAEGRPSQIHGCWLQWLPRRGRWRLWIYGDDDDTLFPADRTWHR